MREGIVMNKRLFKMKKLVASLIALMLAFTLPTVSVAAAVSPVSNINANEALEKNDTRSLIAYYIEKNADLYRENGLKPDFKYFNADNYLTLYQDVAVVVANDRAKALEHYLTFGALEGRLCGTAFDPIAAIKAYPRLALLSPDELYAAYVQLTGANATVASASQSLTETASSGEGGTIIPPVYKDQFGLLVYLCGSDLESKPDQMEASRSIFKILLGAYDDENVNVTILAGGADNWKSVYMNTLLGGRAEGDINKSAIFTVNRAGARAAIDSLIASNPSINSLEDIYNIINDESKASERVSIIDMLINANTLTMVEGSLGKNKMGDVSTLVSLLEAGKKSGANRFALSLWNHGGGQLEGVCFPDDETGSITVPKLKMALDTAGFGSSASASQNKLTFLAFDACLMAGTEAAAYLSDYYDFMFASEEIQNGEINYRDIIRVANSKPLDADLGLLLAQAVIKDRSESATGTNVNTMTAAIFESGKATDSLIKLNEVAKILNNIVAVDADSANTTKIYRAFKNARMKCEQLGSSTTSGQSRDLVDMKNFLQMFIAELDNAGVLAANVELKNALNEACKAADTIAYANAFNYNGQVVYFDNGKEVVWTNKSFWNQVKGMELCGANIYVPLHGTNGKDQQVYADIYANNLSMGDYSTFINSYTDNFLNSAEEQQRIQALAEALLNGQDKDGNPVDGYAKMLDMSLDTTASGKVLSIKVNDYTPEQASEYSSGDSFIDLYETMDTMVLYITRRVLALYSTNNVANSDCVNVDVIVGKKTISYENLNGLNSSVNIFTNYLSLETVNVVKGEGETDSNSLYDFIMPSDMEGYSTKDDIISKFGFSAAKALTAKGTAKVVGINVPIPVYHVFELSEDGKSYVYRGCVEVKDENGAWNIGEKLDTEYITFYHQTVDYNTNKLVYAEEYKWNDEGKANEILSLCNTKKYVTDGTNNITMSAVELGKFGTDEDNGYCFAINQREGTNDRDVFAHNTVKDTNFESANDIIEVINDAMNDANNSQTDNNSPEKAAKPTDEKASDELEKNSNDASDEEQADDQDEATNELPDAYISTNMYSEDNTSDSDAAAEENNDTTGDTTEDAASQETESEETPSEEGSSEEESAE